MALQRRGVVLALVAAGLVFLASSDAATGPEGPVTASITFCSKVGQSSGRPYGVSDTFALGKGDKVFGVVDLEHVRPGEDLVLHLLWVDPRGRGVFRKRVVLRPEGTGARAETSLSLSPKRRDPGTYRLKVYLFRMLLVEKTVELQLPEGGT